MSAKEKKVIDNYDNGLNNKNEFISISKETVVHANEGTFSNLKNPKKIKPGEIRLKSGGHGECGIEVLNSKEIEYNMAKEIFAEPINQYIINNSKVPNDIIAREISFYAFKEYKGINRVNEIMAEYFSIKNSNTKTQLVQFIESYISEVMKK